MNVIGEHDSRRFLSVARSTSERALA